MVDAQIQSGDQIGDYTLGALLGRGDYGPVFATAAHWANGSIPCLAHIIEPPYCQDPRLLATLAAEVPTALRFTHNNAAHLVDVLRAPDYVLLVWERPVAHPLWPSIDRAERAGLELPIPVALYIASVVAGVLDAAHQCPWRPNDSMGLVHGHVGPSSVRVGTGGQVSLLGVGIGRTRALLPFEPQHAIYLAPEARLRGQLTPATDVYGVARLLYRLATGVTGPLGSWRIGEAIPEQLPSPRSLGVQLPGRIEPLLGGALEPGPLSRPTMEELCRGLEAARCDPLEPCLLELDAYVSSLFPGGMSLEVDTRYTGTSNDSLPAIPAEVPAAPAALAPTTGLRSPATLPPPSPSTDLRPPLGSPPSALRPASSPPPATPPTAELRAPGQRPPPTAELRAPAAESPSSPTTGLRPPTAAAPTLDLDAQIVVEEPSGDLHPIVDALEQASASFDAVGWREETPHDEDPADVLAPGSVVGGRYRIDHLLGQGGVARVYAAQHLMLEHPVALKVLRPELSANAGLMERFRREAKAVSQLDHPNIIRVTDFGRTEDARLFLVMELLDGEALSDFGADGLAPDEALPILSNVLSGLHHAHLAGIVHRDLKPENIMLVERDGVLRVKILDFGIAKLGMGEGGSITQAGTVFGTPRFMSPEQAAGEVVDARADLYAIGVILFWLLSGRYPFDGANTVQVLSRVLTQPVPPLQMAGPPKLQQRLQTLLNRALAKEPSQRYQDAQEMRRALDAAWQG